jgi:uncharacterized protein
MNIWTKILLFFPIWLLFSAIFYGIVYLAYPESYSGSRIAFETLITTDYGFLFLSQIALFLGTFASIFFVSKVINKENPAFLKSMLEPIGLLLGIAIGTVEILLIILILSLTTKLTITFKGLTPDIFIYIIIFLLVAVSEEAISRGYIFANLYKQSNKYLAVIISSLIFSLMHVFNTAFSWIGVLNIFLIGMFFCQLYINRMNLSMPIGFHFIWNLLQGPIFGFSVSGFTTQGIFKVENFSGTKFPFEGFGLEGSLISTLIILFFIVCFYITNTKKVISSENIEPAATNITAS